MNKLYLLAGNGSSADWWSDALPHFHHYEPVALELPGFGDNPHPPLKDLSAYAEALFSVTTPGSAIVAVGVNALVTLHTLQRHPSHFGRTILLAPVGAFLWKRRLPALMASRLFRRIAHGLLSVHPRLFARKFSAQRWPEDTHRRMGSGYRRCRAFQPYWDMVRPESALSLLEWIADPVELVWGGRDAVLPARHAAAWSAILARADLSVTIQPEWGHYPWIDSPAAFADFIESKARGFAAHGKSGRLRLAELAGLSVPDMVTVSDSRDLTLTDLLSSRRPPTFQ